MSADRVPSRAEVTRWSPQQLADYLKRMNLSGCDRVVMKNNINGSRFVTLSDNDLQKFPKLHAPMISKLSTEISRKEERRSLFSKKSTPKYHEPDTAADPQGWGEDEFEDFDDDYESPCSGDDEGSGGDYESPTDDVANDYEPPPTEPPDDLPRVGPPRPLGDGDYIDSHVASRAPPPVLCPRPPAASLSLPRPSETPRRDASPNCRGRTFPPEPPKIFRSHKPGRDSGSNLSPVRGGPQRGTDKTASLGRWPQQDPGPGPGPGLGLGPKPGVPPPSSSVSRSDSSLRTPPNRFDARREQTHDEALKHNTFPLHNKSLPPRPGIPGMPSRGDSLPPSVSGAASLPHKLQSAIAKQRGSSFAGADSRPSYRPSSSPSPSSSSSSQELDSLWYVGKVSRAQAEGGLKIVNKDGAFLVRDSTRQLQNQPYTLMVLYQHKVYNLQIRLQNQQFLLGTGLKVHESFPSVSDIIAHYSQNPLLLIDAKNRDSGQQNQCLLSEPAAELMTRYTWS